MPYLEYVASSAFTEIGAAPFLSRSFFCPCEMEGSRRRNARYIQYGICFGHEVDAKYSVQNRLQFIEFTDELLCTYS